MPPSAESGKQEGFEPVSPSPSALSPISTRRRADGLGAPRHNNAAQESRSRSDLTKFWDSARRMPWPYYLRQQAVIDLFVTTGWAASKD